MKNQENRYPITTLNGKEQQQKRGKQSNNKYQQKKWRKSENKKTNTYNYTEHSKDQDP